MTIEQKPELNRFVDPSIPLTWDYRWRQIKILLPIWFFSLLLLLEIGLFRAWLADKLQWDRLAVLIVAVPTMFLFVLAVAEIQTRIQQRSKRVIKVEDQRIILKPAKHSFIRWKQISKFQFEPLLEDSGLMKLKLFLCGRPSKRNSGRAFWSMVLERPTQVQELTDCLQKRRMEAPADFQVEVLEKPLPPEQAGPIPFLGMSLYWGGVLLLLHGVPLLFIGLTDGGHHDSENDSDLAPNEKAKLGRLILKYFHTIEELRHFYIVAGGVLTVLGLLLLIWGWLLMNRKPQTTPVV
ncbi:MAG TPA: hypothetical protein VMB80_13565 [Candidatus Acidoferrum sp.]|nr:hypothetical protein [Candidatus Acidoferrum sp.]